MFRTYRDSKFLLVPGLLLPSAGTYKGAVHQLRLLIGNQYTGCAYCCLRIFADYVMLLASSVTS